MRTLTLIGMFLPLVAAAGESQPWGAIKRLGVTRWRHGSWVKHVAASPDGKVVASCADRGGVRLWEAASGRKIDPGEGHGAAGA